MSTMYVASGVSHKYVPNEKFSLAFDKSMRNWVVQWTTPNNTVRAMAPLVTEVLDLWAQQKFSVPCGFDFSMVKDTLVFIILVEKFVDGLAVSGAITSHRIMLVKSTKAGL